MKYDILDLPLWEDRAALPSGVQPVVATIRAAIRWLGGTPVMTWSPLGDWGASYPRPQTMSADEVKEGHCNGFFDPTLRTIRVRSLGDVRCVTHELAHSQQAPGFYYGLYASDAPEGEEDPEFWAYYNRPIEKEARACEVVALLMQRDDWGVIARLVGVLSLTCPTEKAAWALWIAGGNLDGKRRPMRLVRKQRMAFNNALRDAGLLRPAQ